MSATLGTNGPAFMGTFTTRGNPIYRPAAMTPTQPSATPMTPLTDAVVAKSMQENGGSYLTEDLLLHARTLETELAAAKAECERLKALSDNAASAMQWVKEEFVAMKVRAERAESELTLYRSKVFRMKSILSSIDDDGTEQHHSATAERAEAEVLAQAELLGRSAEREADLLGKLSRAEAALAEQQWLKECAIKRTGEVVAERDALAKCVANVAHQKTHAELTKDETAEVADTADYQGAHDLIIADARAAIDAAMTNSNQKTT